uniref:Hook microtubule tethering protein 1 n=1 Tax=Pavo cristatus TaxID=9049 RepID=A0A8C9G0A9_PAVCR
MLPACTASNLQTFNTAAPCRNVQDLTNGVAMAQVLHQIDVAWFDASWLNRIKEDVGDNWRIKVLKTQMNKSFVSVDLVSLLSLPGTMGPSASDASSEMEQQVTVAALQDEKNSLVSENEILNDRLEQLDDSLDDPNTMVAKKYFHAQLQLEQLQEENFRLEAAKDDYRVHCEDLEKQLIELQHRNNELTSLAEESRALKDENDILRATADKASKLESTVEVYRKKLQDLNDFRRQVKSLQETNMMYMHNTVSLEDELRKANAARAQLETYKRQVQELHNKLSEESKRADKLAFEMKRLEEKHEALVKEKERLIVQCDALKETNEELRYSQMQQDHLSRTDASRVKSHDNLAAELLPVEYREMFIQLQHENKMLLLQQEGSENERITELQKQLEQKQWTVNELETEKRLNKERIGELQQQIEDLQKTLQEQGSKTEGSTNLKQKLAAHMEKLSEVHDELQKKEAALAELQPDVSQNPQKIGELEAALRKKDEDMKAMEERYKMYLEKARNVIKTLDPKLNPASAEIMLLRKQITERDKKIEALESYLSKYRIQHYELVGLESGLTNVVASNSFYTNKLIKSIERVEIQ